MVSNTAISDLTMQMSNDAKISSIIVADSTQAIAIFGNNNTVENIKMEMSVAVTNYCQNEAKLDAQLASSLASTFTGKLESSQVALLGAMNNSSSSVVNMVKNSISSAISTNTVQKCITKMGAEQSITITGNNNTVSNVTMEASRKAVQTCLNSSDLSGNIAAQLTSWADESAKSTQVGPLDGLFAVLGKLAGAPAMIAMALIAGGVIIFLVILFMLFKGGGLPSGLASALNMPDLAAPMGGPVAAPMGEGPTAVPAVPPAAPPVAPAAAGPPSP